MPLFFLGVLEMVIIATWTKVVTSNKIVTSGVVTFINIIIWYYVLQSVIADIKNVTLVVAYAFGCAIGTMLSTFYFSFRERTLS